MNFLSKTYTKKHASCCRILVKGCLSKEMINFQKKVAILEVLCIRGLSELGGVSLRGHLSKGGVCFRGIYSKRSQSASEGGLLMGKYTS